MRITAEAKLATRERILLAAARLFDSNGFDATTTRDIAREAGIATGTLFNYFPTKEAIVAELVSDALAKDSASSSAESFEEDLFAVVARELRRLKPYRSYILPVIETVLNPLASSDRAGSAGAIRARQLERVSELAIRHGMGELSPIALQLYWTLYLGLFAFWASDRSPRQEDTLALADQSISMFVRWLKEQTEG